MAKLDRTHPDDGHTHPGDGHHDDHERLPPGVVRASHEQGGGYFYKDFEILMPRSDAAEVGRILVDLRNRKKRTESSDGDLKRPKKFRPVFKESDVVVVPLDKNLFEPESVPEVIDSLRGTDRESGQPFSAAPHHLLVPGSHPDPFPANAPRPRQIRTLRGAGESNAGEGVKVAVVDSGIDMSDPMFEGRVEFRPGTDEERAPRGRLQLYSGHGTFIAGLVLNHAPAATIVARKVFRGDGFFSDRDLATALYNLPEGVNIVNVSAGGLTHGGQGMPGTESAIMWLLKRDPTMVVVASAGNDGVEQPYFPAAMADVIGVAALDANGERACFSNFGWWVKACATGVDLASSFFRFHGQVPSVHPRPGCHGDGRSTETTETFEGFAVWSGTSFAAPRVAGAIAARMTEMGPGTTAAQAANDLLANQPRSTYAGRNLGVRIEPRPILFN